MCIGRWVVVGNNGFSTYSNFQSKFDLISNTFASTEPVSKIAGILLFVFSLSLGGIQLFLTTGKHMARQRAMKFQRLRNEDKSSLQTLTFTTESFSQMQIEEVGHGVIEFEYQGHKYDAFEVIESDGMVVLLVKRDDLDTLVSHALKKFKRFARAKGQQVKSALFNFYFGPAVLKAKEIIPNSIIMLSATESHYASVTGAIHSPPPEILN